MTRFLGIDYGEKRVGIAVSDEEGKLAFPFKILKNNSELLDTIHNICGEENISEIVIGESLNLSGGENIIMQGIKEFTEKLSGLNLPIHFEKEFLTSIEARRHLSFGGQARGREGKEKNNARKIKKGISKKVDASAAALILQRYLDKKNKTLML